jgi:hypothetical protein
MDSIFNEVCILVTAAFALTLVPGFRRQERSLLSGREQGDSLAQARWEIDLFSKAFGPALIGSRDNDRGS